MVFAIFRNLSRILVILDSIFICCTCRLCKHLFVILIMWLGDIRLYKKTLFNIPLITCSYLCIFTITEMTRQPFCSWHIYYNLINILLACKEFIIQSRYKSINCFWFLMAVAHMNKCINIECNIILLYKTNIDNIDKFLNLNIYFQ